MHRCTSAQLVQIDFGIEYFFRLQRFLPRNFVSLVGRGARHDARERGFGSLFSLVMEFAASNAFDESLFLFLVGKFKVGSELSCHRKFLRLSARLCGWSVLPRFVSPDTKRPSIGRLRRTFCAKKALGYIPP